MAEKIAFSKKWLCEHGYHMDEVSPAYLYNFYGIKGADHRPLNPPISGWYVFINDNELPQKYLTK